MNRIDYNFNSEAVTIDRLLTSFCSEGGGSFELSLPSPAG